MSDPTVIITGASSGIGFDVARRYAERGAAVVLNGRDPDRLAKAAATIGVPDRTAVVAGDIADPATGDHLVRTSVERFGGVDVLVNSAGTFAATPFVDVTEAELDGYLTANLKGTYLTTQAVVRQLIQQGRGGSIVSIGAGLVEHGVGGITASAPLASKGGVHALTISLAAELAPYDIRVNVVAPGLIRTPLFGAAGPDALSGLPALGRIGEVSDTSAAVLYLAAAPYVTGHVLHVDGGLVTTRS
jgi:NAD(P)-dependent dehydrogenase (short-subunit alcohol dehydrogenase family)